MKSLLFRPLTILAVFLLGLLPAAVQGQLNLKISMDRTEFVLYSPISVKVTLTNALGETIDTSKISKEEPWMDFVVTTSTGEEIDPSSRKWVPPNLVLAPGDVKSVSLNLFPFFMMRQAGEYRVQARVNYRGRKIPSPLFRFAIANGSIVWEKNYTAPPDPDDPSKKLRPRTYTLLMHNTGKKPDLYVRIQNPEESIMYCTTLIGEVASYGEPQTRIDLNGNFHIFYQSSARNFTYWKFSPTGKNLVTRYFSNISSVPSMVSINNKETEIVGGEEVFPSKDEPLFKETPR